jgi:sugar phosphate isomerase/epimerase
MWLSGEPFYLKNKEACMKVGLYSITYLGIWYRGGHLPLKQVITKAKALGYDGIEIDLKRPHGFPLDLDTKARAEIRAFAAAQGMEIPAVAANNNFASPIPEHRENELLMVHEQLRLAHDLGAKVLRVFAAWRGVTYRDGVATYDMVKRYELANYPDVTRLERWRWVRECLREAAAWGEQYGVTLALQNHFPMIEGYEDMLAMVHEVGSEYLKCCLDAPCEPSQDSEYLQRAVRATGSLQVLSHFSGEWAQGPNDELLQVPYVRGSALPNYPVFIKTLKEVGYQGWINYEFCHPAVQDHEIAGIEYVDRQAAYAVQYMKRLIQST